MNCEKGFSLGASASDSCQVCWRSADPGRQNLPRRTIANSTPSSTETIAAVVSVRTGSEFDENSVTIKRLSQAEWLKRQARLWEKFDGPCDVRTWDQVSDAEKQQLSDGLRKTLATQ